MTDNLARSQRRTRATEIAGIATVIALAVALIIVVLSVSIAIAVAVLT